MPIKDRSRLTLREDPFPCGYAPRAIHLTQDRAALFVGAKDGSIHGVAHLQAAGRGRRFVQVPGSSRSGVRSLSEWQPEWLWVARRSGEMELIDLKPLLGTGGDAIPHAASPYLREAGSADPVRTVGWVDARRGYVSFQSGGTWVLPRQPIKAGDPASALRQSLADKIELRAGEQPISQLLFLLPMPGPAGQRFVMGNRRGEIFSWDGNEKGEAEQVDLWQEGEEPAFVNHFAVLWNDREREQHGQARGVFLATDRGVHLICGCGPGLRRVPLDLRRLGAVCMSITYAEPESGGPCYVWASDARGDSHLYWGEPPQDPDRIEFHASGMSHAGSQSMLAVSWYRQKDHILMVGQARRNNQIVLTEYREVRQARDGEGDEIRRLLSWGSKQEIQSFWQDQDEDSKRKVKSWPAHAQLSELFEVLAEESKTLKPLLEFLGDPTARSAWEILDEILAEDETGDKACEAIELWTLSLLGIINRTGGDLKDEQREAAYLGIVRWLFDLRQRAVRAPEGDASGAAARQAVLHELEASIGILRKWGLFGEAHGLRENLIPPLSVLREQQQPEQALDRLTYEVLLFERGLDLRVEDRRGNLPGRNAWDVAGVELGGRSFFAVSWHWGGVELFELRQEPGRALELAIHQSIETGDPQPWTGDQLAARDPQQIPRSQFGHSRAVLLGKLRKETGLETGFLLTAPALPPGSEQYLHLSELVLHDDRIEARRSNFRGLPKDESVYSLLDLGDGFGVAGLRSDGGKASCLLFRVTRARGSLSLDYQLYRERRGMEAEDLTPGARNRVWSLASFELTPAERQEGIAYGIVLGCENGEILLLTLSGEDALRGHADWQLVARMSSPVKALACRRVREHGMALRIVAGGADGSVVAWQEIPGGSEEAGAGPAKGRIFASLWAFYEGEEISGLHLVDIRDNDEPGSGTTAMVLAITRAEQCFLYNDRHAIGDSPLGHHPRRIPVPGSRYGQFQRARREPPSAFASYLVPALPAPASEQDRGTGRVAALLTASKHGVVRLLSVHYPHFHRLRKDKFHEILHQWWEIVQGNHQLRLVHAVYRSAPSVELILVRWLLDPSWPKGIGKSPDEIAVKPWMLPRNLRPVLRLSEALNAGDESRVYESLLAALREAFRLEDLHLFEEICEMMLRRGNFDLFELADPALPGDSLRGTAIYLRILDAIEQSIPQWQGSKDRQESLARITVAKNLVDGDTFLRVIEAASHEVEAEKKAQSTIPTPFLNVLRRRIRGARELIVKRDSRVSLEALRAANLSLHRLCKRLREQRRELVWEGLLEPYFQQLTTAAARVFRSPLELNDAMAHGFARTFALAVCACPSAAMRIATRMTETQLISDPDSQDDLSSLVPRQFQLLEQLGTPIPEYARQLFRIASKPPSVGLHPIADPFLLDPKSDWSAYGYENGRDLKCLSNLYGLVNWFIELEDRLSKRPEELDASWAELEGRLDGILDEDVRTLYRHSVDFWLWTVREFAESLLGREVPDPKPADEASCREALGRLVKRLASREPGQAGIRPLMVLYSHRIALWARAMLQELRRRHDELRIFQPEYIIFQRLFDRLRRAAEAFPKSAAVRMNLVQGVLGHHLLEDLDEHILELQEIAHVLDPPLVRRYRRGNRDRTPNPPVAQSFATYLMDRSERAESLPKNLRTLFALLDRTQRQEDLPTFAELLEPFRARNPDFRRVELGALREVRLASQAEFLSLNLILEELDHNDRKHTAPGSEVVVTGRLESEKGPALVFHVSFAISEEDAYELTRSGSRPPRSNLARLWALSENELQSPIEPRPDREVASSGMGLYMANFAAAIVGWELRIADVLHEEREDGWHGHCAFHLTRQPTSGRLRGGEP